MQNARPPTPVATPAQRRTLAGLTALFAVQGAATAFFVLDAAIDVWGGRELLGGAAHDAIEVAVVIALALSVAFTGREIRKVLARQRRMEERLRAASGAFHDLIALHFERWGLTPSERDVAMMAVKGLSIAEIAAARETREGTVKAQCTAIYAKAGVSGRPQLLSLFIDELMEGSLAAPAGGRGTGKGTGKGNGDGTG